MSGANKHESDDDIAFSWSTVAFGFPSVVLFVVATFLMYGGELVWSTVLSILGALLLWMTVRTAKRVKTTDVDRADGASDEEGRD